MLEIEYELREQDLIHFNELQLKNNVEMQKNIRKNRIFVPAVMLLIGMFYYVYYANMLTTVYITLLACVWAIASPYTMKVDWRRKLLASYTEKEKKLMFGRHKLSIEQDGLAEKSPTGRHITPWKNILRVTYLKKYVHIFIDINSAIIIPLETIKTGDWKQFSKQAENLVSRLG